MTDFSVLQSVKRWLPRTQKWLYRQVTALPDSIGVKVACRETLNLEDFPIQNLDSFDERHHRFPPVNWVLDLGRQIPHLADRVEQWELDRWVDWRSDYGQGADIVHSHFGHIGWRDVPVAKNLNARHVATFYGYDCSLLPAQNRIWKQRYPELFSEVDLVLCEGPHMRQTVIDLGCPSEKVSVHHLGVDVDALPFATRERNSSEPVRFLVASSFKPKKGIPDAIEALGRLASDIDFRLTLVGDATHIERSKEEKERIWAKISEHGLDDRIDHLGFLQYDELVDQIMAHDILVAPSRRSDRGDSEGGAPVTLITAQATGMPVVSTTHADIPNVVEHDETGLLGPERDVDALTEHLTTIVTESDRWPTMSKAARSRMDQRFDAAEQSRQLANHYRSLLDD